MRRALVAAIIGYRRHLSGRGPLRAVRCTFAHGESCSAYGLRAAREAPTVGRALGRIRRRLRRCRDASVYVTADGARSLAWNAELERPLDELIAELETDEERPRRELKFSRRAKSSRAGGAICSIASRSRRIATRYRWRPRACVRRRRVARCSPDGFDAP